MTDLSRISPANLSVTTDNNGTCVTADASKPAPEFAEMLKALANPVKPERGRLPPPDVRSFGTEEAKQQVAKAHGWEKAELAALGKWDGTARIEL